MQSQILNEYTKTAPKERFNQGDILRDVSLFIPTSMDSDGAFEMKQVFLKYCVVVNQDCDLEHDFNSRLNSQLPNQDKYLPNILVLPAYLAAQLRDGSHRGESIKGESWTSRLWSDIQKNHNARFHTITPNESFQIPDLVVDFKHFYTIDRGFIYSQINDVYLASICEVYRESLSQRYTIYLGRIGLPERTSD